MSSKSVLVIAGEKSGEEHAMTFFDDIKKGANQSLDFFGVGGDELAAKGMDILYHVKDFGFFGFSGILKAYPYYRKAFHHLLSEVDKRKCQNAILIDFQTFNLKIAEALHQRGVRVFYYVAPQAWGWKAWRAKTLAKVTFALFTILGFEKKWFKDRGVSNVISVSHPIYRKYQDYLPVSSKDRREILFLPGSRESEVKFLIPIFAEVSKKLQKEGFSTSIVCSDSVRSGYFDLYHEFFNHHYHSDEIAQAMTRSQFAFAASGTVTLSLALFQVPSIVCYKVSLLNEFIFTNLVKVSGWVSLANILHQKEVFPEYLQSDLQVANLYYRFKVMMKEENYSKLKETLKETESYLAGEEENVGTYISENLL